MCIRDRAWYTGLHRTDETVPPSSLVCRYQVACKRTINTDKYTKIYITNINSKPSIYWYVNVAYNLKFCGRKKQFLFLTVANFSIVSPLVLHTKAFCINGMTQC